MSHSSNKTPVDPLPKRWPGRFLLRSVSCWTLRWELFFFQYYFEFYCFFFFFKYFCCCFCYFCVFFCYFCCFFDDGDGDDDCVVSSIIMMFVFFPVCFIFIMKMIIIIMINYLFLFCAGKWLFFETFSERDVGGKMCCQSLMDVFAASLSTDNVVQLML